MEMLNCLRENAQKLSRRHFLKAAGCAMALVAISCFQFPVQATTQITWNGPYVLSKYDSSKPTVYFTRDLSPAGVEKIYKRINQGITGKVAIKLHTGEPQGPNLLPIEYIKNLQAKIPNSAIVETNVRYKSPRRETKTHLETIKTNGFNFCPVDILDADGDTMWPIPSVRAFLDKYVGDYSGKYPFEPGIHLDKILVGKHTSNYESLLVYSHFKGHAMGGFGGALKNIGIGMASREGKTMIHGDGYPTGKGFIERMVESGKAITEHFKGHIAYINVLKNISVDCDCNVHGAKPTCDDIGILGSTDILAAEQAAVDMLYQMHHGQGHDVIERIESRSGLHQLEYMETLNMGSRAYNLVEL